MLGGFAEARLGGWGDVEIGIGIRVRVEAHVGAERLDSRLSLIVGPGRLSLRGLWMHRQPA